MASLIIDRLDQLDTPRQVQATKPSFFKRLVAAVMASNQRRAEIAIRQHLALIGEPRERHDYALLPFRGE